MITIYGNKFSHNCIGVEYIATILGIEYNYKEISFEKGENKTEEFLKISPTGKVPAMDDDGFTLFESGAITKYLCEKSKSDLYPVELKERAVVNAWIDFSVIHIGSAMGRLAFNKLMAKQIGVEVDENSIKTGEEFMKKYLPIVESQLSSNKYLAGDKMSLADTVLLSQLMYAEPVGIDFSPYPSISKWRNNLMEMDFYKSLHKEN